MILRSITLFAVDSNIICSKYVLLKTVPSPTEVRVFGLILFSAPCRDDGRSLFAVITQQWERSCDDIEL